MQEHKPTLAEPCDFFRKTKQKLVLYVLIRINKINPYIYYKCKLLL